MNTLALVEWGGMGVTVGGVVWLVLQHIRMRERLEEEVRSLRTTIQGMEWTNKQRVPGGPVRREPEPEPRRSDRPAPRAPTPAPAHVPRRDLLVAWQEACSGYRDEGWGLPPLAPLVARLASQGFRITAGPDPVAFVTTDDGDQELAVLVPIGVLHSRISPIYEASSPGSSSSKVTRIAQLARIRPGDVGRPLSEFGLIVRQGKCEVSA